MSKIQYHYLFHAGAKRATGPQEAIAVSENLSRQEKRRQRKMRKSRARRKQFAVKATQIQSLDLSKSPGLNGPAPEALAQLQGLNEPGPIEPIPVPEMIGNGAIADTVGVAEGTDVIADTGEMINPRRARKLKRKMNAKQRRKQRQKLLKGKVGRKPIAVRAPQMKSVDMSQFQGPNEQIPGQTQSADLSPINGPSPSIENHFITEGSPAPFVSSQDVFLDPTTTLTDPIQLPGSVIVIPQIDPIGINQDGVIGANVQWPNDAPNNNIISEKNAGIVPPFNPALQSNLGGIQMLGNSPINEMAEIARLVSEPQIVFGPDVGPATLDGSQPFDNPSDPMAVMDPSQQMPLSPGAGPSNYDGRQPNPDPSAAITISDPSIQIPPGDLSVNMPLMDSSGQISMNSGVLNVPNDATLLDPSIQVNKVDPFLQPAPEVGQQVDIPVPENSADLSPKPIAEIQPPMNNVQDPQTPLRRFRKRRNRLNRNRRRRIQRLRLLQNRGTRTPRPRKLRRNRPRTGRARPVKTLTEVNLTEPSATGVDTAPAPEAEPPTPEPELDCISGFGCIDWSWEGKK